MTTPSVLNWFKAREYLLIVKAVFNAERGRVGGYFGIPGIGEFLYRMTFNFGKRKLMEGDNFGSEVAFSFILLKYASTEDWGGIMKMIAS